jgi:aspartate 1-decarboxylase
MLREMLKSKIHGAVLCETNIDYAGSVTIPADICAEADLLAGEKVQVVNVNTGMRLETYVIAGGKPRHFALNGGAARCGLPGDRLLVISYAILDDAQARRFRPTILVMDGRNRVARRKGPQRRSR